MEETAAQREAEGVDVITIELEGLEFVVPTSIQEWPLAALEAFENGKAVGCLRGLFGSAQYDKLLATFEQNHGHPMRMRDLTDINDAVARAAGFGNAGE